MNRLRSISEFCPPGTQIKSPGGLSFDPNDVAGLESYSDSDGDGWPRIIIRWLSGGAPTTIRFHRNVDGGTADVYGVARSIELASSLPDVPKRSRSTQ